MRRRGAARHAGRPAHPERGQGRGHRHRPRRQGAGRRHGARGCCGSTAAPKPADAADALALAICHIWRGARHRAGSSGRSPPPARVAPSSARAMIARCSGPVAARRASTTAVRRGRVGSACAVHVHPPHASPRLPAAARRPARHLAGRPRGLADPVRLRRRRRARGVRDCCRPSAASGRGWRWRCSRCTAPTQLRRAVADERRQGAHAASPASARKGAQRIVLELKDKLGAAAGGRGRSARRARPRRTTAGATRSHEALVGLGWSATRGRRRRRRRVARAAPTAPIAADRGRRARAARPPCGPLSVARR